MSMGLKAGWRKLRASEPGERFRDSYERRSQGRSPARKGVSIALGVLISLAGIVLLAIPGPGIPVVAIGAALIAREWSWAARLLDRAELWIRKVLSWTLKAWSRSPSWAKVLIALGAVAIAGALSVGTYQLTMGR